MAEAAEDIIRRTVTALGIIEPGEYAGWADANKDDALERLNNMVSIWRTQFGTVYAVERNVFPLVSGKQTYTIGVGGDFNVVRPITIPAAGLLLSGLGSAKSATITRSGYVATVTATAHGLSIGSETLIQGANEIAYNGMQTVQTVPSANTFTFTVDGLPDTPATGTITETPLSNQPVEIPYPVITDSGYQAIQIKTLPNSQFTAVYYNPTFPYGTIYLWPLPNTAVNQLVLYLQSAFAGFADLTTEYDFPSLPGYTMALEDGLAVEMSMLPLYGIPADVAQRADAKASKSLGLIKRANNQLVDLPTDAQLLTRSLRGGYNINTGTGGT